MDTPIDTPIDTRGQHTLAEIISQPDVWAAALDHFAGRAQALRDAWDAAAPRQVLVTGCGSTYSLAQIAAGLIQRLTGLPARGVPASEIALYPEQTLYDPGHTLLLAVSRSGTTTETAAALDQFRRSGGGPVWGITCYAGTPIADETDFSLLLPMAQEQSVAQTRSFSTMLLACQALAAAAGKHDLTPLQALPAAGRRLLDATYGLATQWGTQAGLEKFFFLGSGPRYGLACEAMLKMKEMSITHSEAFHFLEFRHGPKSMVDDAACVIGLLGSRTFDHEAAVLNEMMSMGGTTIALAPGSRSAGHITVHLPEDLPDWAGLPLYLPVLQSMAHARAVGKELDPDAPRNLTAVVFLDRAALR